DARGYQKGSDHDGTATIQSAGMDRRTLAAALAFLAVAVLWAAPASLHPTRTVPDLGDPLHLGWTMAWDAHQIVRHPLALFEANGFYPYRGSLTFADHLLP